MKKQIPSIRNLLLAALALGLASVQAANTVNFDGVTLEGLTTLTDTSAFNNFSEAAKTGAIAVLTDANWNNGGVDSMNGGPLVGEFGQTFSASGNYLYLLSPGLITNTGHSNHIGTFTAALLLANDQLVSAGAYDDLSFTVTAYAAPGIYYGRDGINDMSSYGPVIQYVRIDLGLYDTQGVGVKGVKLDNFTGPWLDLNYVGITAAPIPEPSTYSLVFGGLALAGAAIRRRQLKK